MYIIIIIIIIIIINIIEPTKHFECALCGSTQGAVSYDTHEL